jgi:hypothetical protein
LAILGPVINSLVVLLNIVAGTRTLCTKQGCILAPGKGRTAVPLTRTEHKKIPTQTNQKILKSNGVKRFLGGLASIAANIGTEITGIVTNNPDASINQFGSRFDLGVLYKNNESGLYYTITSLQKNDKSGTANFWLFSSYEWDEKQKKFVGVNPVGYGTQYEEKNGYRETQVFDLDGKPRAINRTGGAKASKEIM